MNIENKLHDNFMMKIVLILFLHPDISLRQIQNLDNNNKYKNIERIKKLTINKMRKKGFLENLVIDEKVNYFIIDFDEKIKFWEKIINQYMIDTKKGVQYKKNIRYYHYMRWNSLISLTVRHFS